LSKGLLTNQLRLLILIITLVQVRYFLQYSLTPKVFGRFNVVYRVLIDKSLIYDYTLLPVFSRVQFPIRWLFPAL